jgi:hypothetical protein
MIDTGVADTDGGTVFKFQATEIFVRSSGALL